MGYSNQQASRAIANYPVQKNQNGLSLPAVSTMQLQKDALIQRAALEEEPIQGKFAAIQMMEEEEPLQGKFDTLQMMEEEEPVQGKFNTIQMVEEEEPLQGKFFPIQKVEEEEPLQGKFGTIQKQALQAANNTGMPDNLKSGIEGLSGVDVSDVRVHYNSSKPAQLNAHAYAQGTDIHIGPGQEKHLPHEAWHTVQQKQGRVKPTLQMKDKLYENNVAQLNGDSDDEDGDQIDYQKLSNWSKTIKKVPGYTCWGDPEDWHINWRLGDTLRGDDQYHVTRASDKTHYFFILGSNGPEASVASRQSGAKTFDSLPEIVKVFIRTNWQKILH